MKRKNLYIFAAAVVVLILCIVCSVNFLQAARSGEAELKNIEQRFNTTPALGKLVDLELSCYIPWGQSLAGVDFLPGEGLLLQKNISIDSTTYTAKKRTLHIKLPVKSYRSGKLDLGRVELKIERPWHKSAIKKQTITANLGALEFAPLKVENPDQLPLADSAKLQQKTNSRLYYYLAAAGLILLGAIIAIYLKYRKNHQRQQEILPPWEIARRNLDELRKTANAGKQPLEWCVVKLTDVVREYLSIRFNWRVKQQTTEEFFASLKRKNSPLSATQTFYLEEFMKQSDLIKFANIKPDKDTFAQAIDRAEDLVNETGATAPAAENDPEKR